MLKPIAFAMSKWMLLVKTALIAGCMSGSLLADPVWAQNDPTDTIISSNPLLKAVQINAPAKLPDILKDLLSRQSGGQSPGGLTKDPSTIVELTKEEKYQLKHNPAFAESFKYNQAKTLRLLRWTMKLASQKE